MAKKRAAGVKPPAGAPPAPAVPLRASLSQGRGLRPFAVGGSAKPGTFADPYESKKQAENRKQRASAADVRDIGEIPAPEDPARRARCREDLGLFLKTYFPETFRHRWSSVHRRLIELISVVVLVGALLAIGIPRGWGKTSLCVRAVIWAVAYRHHVFCVLIAASNEAAKSLIADIRAELETNVLLRADFPELCLPVAALEGVNQRGRAQLSCGERTKVFASDFELRLGDVCGQTGAIIRAGGILSSKIRGARHVAGGAVIRPTLGLVDDPQTEASAASPRSCYRRERIIQAALPGLPGAGEAWSCLLTVTPIEPGDVADRVLDRDRNPDWHGVRQAALESLPNDEALELWSEWNDIRQDCLLREEDLERAHKFYRKNRRAMNAGAAIVWADGFDPERFVDPLEQCMDWFFRDRQGFWSELMVNPAGFEVKSGPVLDRDTLARRMSHLPAGRVPLEAEFVTAFADVQGKCLFYEVRAHAQDSSSWVLQYGTFPEQPRQYFALKDVRITLDSIYPTLHTLEERLVAAVRDLFSRLFSGEWKREDGQTLRLNVAGVDANWQTETVKRAVRRSGFVSRLLPTHGRSFRPPRTSLNDLPEKPGDRIGSFWRLRSPREKEAIRHVLFDTDFWKSFRRDRLAVPPEAVGALVLPAGRDHSLWAEHQLAETSSLIQDVSTQRTVEVWELRPDRPDNHFLDCTVGNSVLGAMLGVQLPGSADESGPSRKRPRPRRGGSGSGYVW